MLDDLAVVVEAEDVDPGVVLVVGPVLKAVMNDEVVFGDGGLENARSQKAVAASLLPSGIPWRLLL